MNLSFPFLSVKKMAFFFLIIIVLMRIVYYTATEGFCLERICAASLSKSKENAQSAHRLLSSEFPSHLKNSVFHYLKKGSQAYAFVSEDGHYVLKLFKRHHMQEALWLHSVPTFGVLTTWKELLLQKRKKRLDLSLGSYILAATRLQNQCAILSYQLEPTDGDALTVELLDGIGRRHTVALDRCGYVLQKKASLLFPTFSSWIEKGDFESVKIALRSLIDLIAYRSRLGIQDIDPDLHKNAGLVGTEAIFIDIGSFTQKEHPLSKEDFSYDLRKIFNELRKWLASKEESLDRFLEQAMDEAIHHYE